MNVEFQVELIVTQWDVNYVLKMADFSKAKEN